MRKRTDEQDPSKRMVLVARIKLKGFYYVGESDEQALQRIAYWAEQRINNGEENIRAHISKVKRERDK